jgi:hypothetical protein
LKRALLEVTHQRFQVLIEVLRKHLDTDPVDASLAFVAFDRSKGFVHQLERNPSRQRVMFDLQRFY